MDTIIPAPASCEVRAVICFLHAEGQSAAEIHHRLCRVHSDNEWQLCENGAENSGMGALMCTAKVVKDDAQLWLTNSLKKSTNACVENVSRYQNFPNNFHKLRGLLCVKLSWTVWVTVSSVQGGYQNNWLTFTKLREWGQPWRFSSATGKRGTNFLTESCLVTRLGYSSWMQRPESSLNCECTRILPTSPRNSKMNTVEHKYDGYSILGL